MTTPQLDHPTIGGPQPAPGLICPVCRAESGFAGTIGVHPDDGDEAAFCGYRDGFGICWVHQTQALIPGHESLFAGRAAVWRRRGCRTTTTEKLPW